MKNIYMLILMSVLVISNIRSMETTKDSKEQSDDENSLLHKAILQQMLEAAKVLIKAGKELNTVNKRGFTPLHLAAGHGHEEITKALLEKTDQNTSKPEVNVNAQDKCGRTPLHWAVENGHQSIIDALLKRGADITIKDFRKQTVKDLAKIRVLFNAAYENNIERLQEFVNKNYPITNIVDSQKNTILHRAVSGGAVNAIKFILKIDSTLASCKNAQGITPFDIAKEMAEKYNNTAAFDALVFNF